MVVQNANTMVNELVRKASTCTMNLKGSVEVSNNLCKQRLKLGNLLKKCMNIDSETVTFNVAFIFSLIESSKFNDVNPQDYLRHLFKYILYGKDGDKKVFLL